MLHPGKEIDGGTFNGTAEQARMFLGLFALIIAFGLTAAIMASSSSPPVARARSSPSLSLAAAAVLVLAAVAVIGIPGAK